MARDWPPPSDPPDTKWRRVLFNVQIFGILAIMIAPAASWLWSIAR